MLVPRRAAGHGDRAAGRCGAVAPLDEPADGDELPSGIDIVAAAEDCVYAYDALGLCAPADFLPAKLDSGFSWLAADLPVVRTPNPISAGLTDDDHRPAVSARADATIRHSKSPITSIGSTQGAHTVRCGARSS